MLLTIGFLLLFSLLLFAADLAGSLGRWTTFAFPFGVNTPDDFQFWLASKPIRYKQILLCGNQEKVGQYNRSAEERNITEDGWSVESRRDCDGETLLNIMILEKQNLHSSFILLRSFVKRCSLLLKCLLKYQHSTVWLELYNTNWYFNHRKLAAKNKNTCMCWAPGGTKPWFWPWWWARL